MSINQNEKVKKAKEECEYLQGDEAAQRLEELRNRAIRDEKAAFSCGVRQGETRGIGIGKALGEARGEKNGRKAMSIETAKGMLKDKLDKKLIIKYTGLTEKEIEAIAL